MFRLSVFAFGVVFVTVVSLHAPAHAFETTPNSQEDPQATGWDEAVENSLIFSNPFADTTEVLPTHHTYFKAGIAQDVPADASSASGWQPGQSYHEQGTLGVAETGFRHGGKDQFGVGGWQYTANPDAFTPPDQKPSTGMYVLAERTFFNQDNKTVTGFAKAGHGELEQGGNGWSTGFAMKGFVDDHPDGQFNFAVTGVRDQFAGTNVPMGRMQTRVELTYQDKITDNVTIQPGLNFNVHPGSDPAAAGGLVAGLRVHVRFK